MQDNILRKVEEINDWLIDVRRDIHMNPELGMEEFRTRDKIIDYLESFGIEYKKIANTGVLGIIRGKSEGKTVALRADIDALPIQDEKDLPYKSTVPGKMHACGHDAHTTVLLGAARLLKEMEDEISGNVKLFFQPAEETVGGAKPMIEEGAMENPRVDAVFGLHVAPEITVGEIGVKYGRMNASSDGIRIIIRGNSAHGASPQGGIDAIVIASSVVSSLQTIVSRNVGPLDSAVLTIGKINGGTQANIIADKVELVGTLRTLDPEIRAKVKEKIKKITTKTAESMDGRAEIIINEGYIALINDDDMVDIVKEGSEKILGSDKVRILENPSLGVEDFSYFAAAAPSAFFRLGTRTKGEDMINAHHPLFDIDEKSLSIGVAVQISNVLSFLSKK